MLGKSANSVGIVCLDAETKIDLDAERERESATTHDGSDGRSTIGNPLFGVSCEAPLPGERES